MPKKLLATVAALALASGGAFAQDLKFPVGEGAFNWDSYKAFDEATNLDGQTLTGGPSASPVNVPGMVAGTAYSCTAVAQLQDDATGTPTISTPRIAM